MSAHLSQVKLTDAKLMFVTGDWRNFNYKKGPEWKHRSSKASSNCLCKWSRLICRNNFKGIEVWQKIISISHEFMLLTLTTPLIAHDSLHPQFQMFSYPGSLHLSSISASHSWHPIFVATTYQLPSLSVLLLLHLSVLHSPFHTQPTFCRSCHMPPVFSIHLLLPCSLHPYSEQFCFSFISPSLSDLLEPRL